MTHPTAITSVSIEAQGHRFDTDVAGPEEGEVVLLLHGFPQTRYTWREEIRVLADAGYRACAPNQRGYSPGARPEDIESYRVETLTSDALAIVDTLGCERFHLVGHDWGGQLAWITASLHPERVRSLSVLSRPHPRAFLRAVAEDPEQPKRSRHHQSFLRPEATAELLADDCARLRLALTKQGVPESAANAYLETLGEHAGLDAAIHWYRAAASSKLDPGTLPPLRVPTLYVWGNHDATVGRRAAEATREFVEAPFRFVELEGIGHFITDQAPSAFPPLLLDHLRAPEAAT